MPGAALTPGTARIVPHSTRREKGGGWHHGRVHSSGYELLRVTEMWGNVRAE